LSYRFEAEPKVVQSRSKYRATENETREDFGSSGPIIIKDSRNKTMTPAQQEEEYVRIEKDRMKLENMHKQLLAFKQSKKKVSPYDIKPSANPKVNANLTFFLTDSTDTKAPQTNIDVQTDVFKERPKSPAYVPKKTGRDVSTQVEDNELFNFDREVTPIIDVIVTKTVEQSLIEIEEEEEISRIKKFKEEFWKRRQEDEQKWKIMLEKELQIISIKENKLEEYRIREEKRIRVLRKVQSYQLARLYLRDVGFNSLSFLHNNGLYHNQEREELVNKLPPFMVDGVFNIVNKRQNHRTLVANAFTHIEGELMTRREVADNKYKKRLEKRRIKRINHSKEERLVRFIYMDETTPSSYFVRFISKLQEPDLSVYFDDYRSRVNQLKEKLQNSELAQEEYDDAFKADFPELQIPNNLRIILNNIQKFSFNVANNIYYSELQRDGFFDVSVSTFSKEGNFLYQIDKANPRNSSQSIKYLGNIRDSQIKTSDDLGIKINLNKIEEEVTKLVLTVEIPNLEQSIAIFNDFLQYSRFRLAEWTTDQTIEETNIFSNFKLEELKDTSAESELGGKIICYTIYRAKDFGWVFESIQSFKNVPIESASEFNSQVVNYLQICMDEQHREMGDQINQSASLIQESFDKGEKDKVKSLPKDTKTSPITSAVTSKVIEPKKEEDEGVASYSANFVTKTFGPLKLKATDDLEEITRKVEETLEKENPVLLSSFEYGYEIVIGEHELVRSTQVKKVGPVTSFMVKRKPKPYEEPIIPEGEEGEEGDEEGDEDASDE